MGPGQDWDGSKVDVVQVGQVDVVQHAGVRHGGMRPCPHTSTGSLCPHLLHVCKAVLVRVAQHRHHQALGRGHGDADVAVVPEAGGGGRVFERCTEASGRSRELAHCAGDCSHWLQLPSESTCCGKKTSEPGHACSVLLVLPIACWCSDSRRCHVSMAGQVPQSATLPAPHLYTISSPSMTAFTAGISCSACAAALTKADMKPSLTPWRSRKAS